MNIPHTLIPLPIQHAPERVDVNATGISISSRKDFASGALPGKAFPCAAVCVYAAHGTTQPARKHGVKGFLAKCPPSFQTIKLYHWSYCI